MERVPEVVKVVMRKACPLFRVAEPSEVEPALKMTLPVGQPPNAPVTVLVRVTFWPTKEGLGEEIIVFVVPALFTTRLMTGEVLPDVFASPL